MHEKPEPDNIIFHDQDIFRQKKQDGNLTTVQQIQSTSGPYTLRIDGIEATQATQFYDSHKHLDPPHAKPDNWVPMIAYKPLVLRVYPSLSAWLGFAQAATDQSQSLSTKSLFPKFVDGYLHYRNPYLPGSQGNNPFPAAKLNGPIEGRVSSIINRGDQNQTLNFLIPAHHAFGAIYVWSKVWVTNYVGQLQSETVNGWLFFEGVPSLKFYVVRFNYDVNLNGDHRTFPAPDLNTFVTDYNNFTRKIVPSASFSIEGSMEHNIVYSQGNAPQSSAEFFPAVKNMLEALKGNSSEIYVGLLPNGLPQGIHYQAWNGIGGGGVFVYKQADKDTLAHELGHALGRAHAPGICQGQETQDTDPAYPQYGTYPNGSIGEYGIEISNNTIQVKNPQSYPDFMGYCAYPDTTGIFNRHWISPYHYMKLKNDIKAYYADIQLDETISSLQQNEQQFLFLGFKINRNGKVEMLPSFHYPAYPKKIKGKWTPFLVESRDENDAVISAERLSINNPYESLDSAVLHFLIQIPFSDKITRISIKYDPEQDFIGGKEIYSIQVPEFNPMFDVDQHLDYNNNSANLKWTLRDVAEKSCYFMIQYSNDDGKSWRNMTSTLRTREYTAKLNNLAGGEKCKFQVLVTQGIRTVSKITQPFRIQGYNKTAE